MFASGLLRSLRPRNGVFNGMFPWTIIVCIFALIIILIPTNSRFNALARINNYSVFKISKRHFIKGSGWNGNNGNGNFFYGTSTGGSSGSSESAGNVFTYKAAVAYKPKDRDDAIYKNLKDSLQSPTGEDNYFIRINSPSDIYAGVADGVGGWAEHGYDSSKISRELCIAMSELSASASRIGSSKKNIEISPVDLMDQSYKKIRQEKIVEVGSTTAIVAHFPQDGHLKVANLGDSWCGVFRDNKLVFETKFQTLGFNTPYQLSIIPEKFLLEAKRRGSSYITNTPSDSDSYDFQLSKNDLIILATDGVTDNISTGDIELYLQENKIETQEQLEKSSSKFVTEVVQLSKDPEYPSVFAQELSRLSGKKYSGGKEDDITVVMIKVD